MILWGSYVCYTTNTLDTVEGLFVPFARVGSGDLVRVLRLFHNKYTGYNWRFICRLHMRRIRWSFVGLTSIPQWIHWIQLEHARFICTVCMCRIHCEGLMSVTQQIHWIQLKHLLLRHMYNLPLPKLHATLLVAHAQLFSAVVTQQMNTILYCTVWCLLWLLV